jgi:hypothetical protein
MQTSTYLAPPSSGSFTRQSMADDELVSKLLTDWQYLFGLRGNWNSHWTEIAQRIYPMESWLFQNFSQLNMQGDKRNFEVYDSTGILALQRFGAILDSLLTPRDQFWHQIKPSDDALLKDKATRLWYERANNVLFEERYSPKSNFAAQNQGQYLSLGAYGTGVLFIDRLAGTPGIRYKHVHLGECYLQENHQGMVDRNCRHFMMTARQAYQMFGEECPDNIITVKDRFPDRQFFFLHWVMPNDDRDPDRKDYKGMEYSSLYISIEGRKIVKRGGYTNFPYAISRYYQAPNEAYGRSIAMDVLPSLKTLNEQKKTMLKQGHRALDPVLLAHDDGVIDGFSLAPGAINSGGVSADGRLLIQPLPMGNVQAGQEIMKDERDLINDSFLISLFQVLTENPQMTATEVLERTREKGILLAPTIGRQQSEYLGPMIDRELDLLSAMGKLPPQTGLMKEAKGQYKTIYDSPITRTQKAEWASGAQRTIETLMNLATATQDPSYLFYIDFDIAAPIIASINGTPASWIRSKDDVAKLKAAHAKQQQMQQAIQAAPALAGAAKAHAQMQQNAPAPAPQG